MSYWLRDTIGLLLAMLILAGCNGNRPTTLENPINTMAIASVVMPEAGSELDPPVELAAQVVTATLVPTNSPPPPSTPTPRFTITPNAPGIVGNLVYAKPPRQRGFTRPSAVISSILKIINQTDLFLLVTLQGIEDAAPISPGGSTEWQVAPGTYTYSVVAEFGGLAFLQDTVTVEKGDVITIIIKEGVASQVVFVNQTNVALVIDLPKAGKSFNLAAGETSAALLLPPATYDFTASALSAVPYQGNFALEGSEKLTITLIGKEIFGNSSVTVNNQTNFAISFTISDLDPPIVVNAGQHSEPIYLPAGDYNYSVCAQTVGANCHSDSFTIRSGENVEILVDGKILRVSSVRFRNETSFALVITVEGVTQGLVLPANSTSAPINLSPDTYTYSACDQQSGTTCGADDFTVNAEENLEITLKQDVFTSSTVRFKNQTPHALVIEIPEVTRGVTIPPGGASDPISILPGNYTYNASSVDNAVAPFTGNFTIEQSKELTIELILSGGRAILTVFNRTSCLLTFNLNGPSTFSFMVGAGERKSVDIPDGNYTYSASACNASTGGSFSGSHEIEFFLQ